MVQAPFHRSRHDRRGRAGRGGAPGGAMSAGTATVRPPGTAQSGTPRYRGTTPPLPARRARSGSRSHTRSPRAGVFAACPGPHRGLHAASRDARFLPRTLVAGSCAPMSSPCARCALILSSDPPGGPPGPLFLEGQTLAASKTGAALVASTVSFRRPGRDAGVRDRHICRGRSRAPGVGPTAPWPLTPPGPGGQVPVVPLWRRAFAAGPPGT